MLPTLSGPSHPPASGGKPRQLVLLLHGLGADGNDLIGLAPFWSRILPDAEFLSPNAPFPCDMAPYGYQWFSLQDRAPATILSGVRAAAPMLDACIDEALSRRGLAEKDLALIGFSQGTMMSLHVGLRRVPAVAGILGFSGSLIGAETLPREIRAKPRVLLVHGDADPIVPFQALAAAKAALDACGVPVETLARPGLQHGIDEEGLKRGARFLKEIFAV
ncbi:MAG: prolyl oligopeptidase family serine peptidase [Alphaproteobacteria bacterium]|nr:prolyl oligopeptidase family serine peptidase [Alphaproteobacteria bacterium]